MNIKNLFLKIKEFVKQISTKDLKKKTPLPKETSLPESTENLPSKPALYKPIVESMLCPYCGSQNYVRRGFRMKRYERIQLYLCLNCRKTFTPQPTLSGKHYPLPTIFRAISLYNLGYSLEDTCKIVNSKSTGSDSSETDPKNNFELGASTLSSWLKEFSEYTKYARMREFAMKLMSPKDTVVTATLAHQQLYRYHFHRAKCHLMIQEEYIHRRFKPLQEFLELVPTECPHQYFSNESFLRASESPLTFSKKHMIVRSKQNYATKMCSFVLQGSKDRKQRHKDLQNFFLYNDSVTVATEVPVYLTREDLEHLKTQLGFELYLKPDKSLTSISEEILPSTKLPKLITGHIDMVQIRNGQIHILDYKPNADKEQPIDQLTLYAMALSRLTGLRLFEFKCAWFDEENYFEFYPLHVLHKPGKARRRKKVETMEGTYEVNKNDDKIQLIINKLNKLKNDIFEDS
ncbi:MAG: PD-(D/E)XK nuclease family protein [bacterium]